MRAIVVPPPPPPEITSEPIVDPAAVRDWISYVREAVRHHALLAIVVFLATAGGAASVPWLLGRTYHVEATLLAQRSQVMPALGNPTRAIPSDADAPTRAAAEIVLRRSNLVALARQTNLLETWEHGRAPLLRLKDRVLALGHRPLEEDEKLDALLGLVEKRLWVHAGEGTVTIAFDWHDPQAAHRLVEAAQENFLEARHVAEVSTIAEAISILEAHAAEVREGILTAIDDLDRMKPRQPPRRPAASPPVTTRRSEQRAQLLVLLNGKRRAIADLEEFRRRRLAELQAQLVQRRASYHEIHPMILDLKGSIEALERESPQISALRREEAQLASEYERAGGPPPGSEEGLVLPPTPPEAIALSQGPLEEEEAAHEFARARLRFAIGKYEALLERIEAARIELDTARAAFKYRYSVVRPSQVPRRPSKPKLLVLVAAGVCVGAMLAVLLPVALRVLSGRAHEPWQLERVAGIRFLGKLGS